MTSLPPPVPANRPHAGEPSPPYWRRRLVVAGGFAITLGLATLGVLAIVSDDEDAEPAWNAVAVIDRDSGQLEVYGADGDLVDRISTGLIDIRSMTVRGHHALLEHGPFGDTSMAVLDVETGEVREIEVDDELDVAWMTTTNEPVVMVTDPDDGNVILIDAPTGATIDVADAAGLPDAAIDGEEVLSSPDGRTFAMTDRETIQTPVVGFDSEEVVFVPPGELVAMSDEAVVTLQRTGPTSFLAIAALDGEHLGLPQVPTPVEVVLVERNTAVLADGTGRVMRMSVDDDEPTVLIDLPEELGGGDDGDPARTTGVNPTRDVTTDSPDNTDDTRDEEGTSDADESDRGDGIVIRGLDDEPAEPPTATAEIHELHYLEAADRLVIRADGEVVVLSTTGDVLASEEGDLWRTPDVGDQCVAVDAENEVLLLDAATGEELGRELRGTSRSASAWSADGCVVDVNRSPSRILTPDGTNEVDGRTAAVSPDGDAVLTLTAPGEVQLAALDDPNAPVQALDGELAAFVHLPDLDS